MENLSNQPHTRVKRARHTSDYWRAFFTALAGRYGLRVPGFHEYKDGLYYDIGTGAMTAAVNVGFSIRIATDIRDVFAEAVALEKNKPLKKVGWGDFLDSDNAIVQTTKWNFFKESLKRFGSDLIAIVPRLLGLKRPLPNKDGEKPPICGADALVAGKAVLLTWDNISKKPLTTFETLVEFINEKINPENAFGTRISIGDITALYQSYATHNDPERKYTIYAGKGVWEKSEEIPRRIAELMNRTYRYNVTDEEAQQSPDNLTLPKLIYLLGHHLIDPREVKRTLAYVEVANQYGIEVVKDVQHSLKSGMPLEQALIKYPVTLPPPAYEKAEQSSPAVEAPVREAAKTKWTDVTPRANQRAETAAAGVTL